MPTWTAPTFEHCCLTFFFRQMPELVKQGRIFIAQPPLYQVTPPQEERVRPQRAEDARGAGSAGCGRDDGSSSTTPTAASSSASPATGWRSSCRILESIADLVQIAERRGIAIQDLLDLREQDPTGEGRMPRLRLTVPPIESQEGDTAELNAIAGDHFFWSEEDEQKFQEAHQLGTSDPEMDEVIDGHDPDAPHPRPSIRKELHEVRDLEKQIARLADMGLPIEDYVLEKTRSVTGLPEPTKYELIVDAKAAAKQAVAVGADDGERERGAVQRRRPRCRVGGEPA